MRALCVTVISKRSSLSQNGMALHVERSAWHAPAETVPMPIWGCLPVLRRLLIAKTVDRVRWFRFILFLFSATI